MSNNPTKMLINAQRPEQLRVAIVEGTTLGDLHVDFAESGLCRGNIYRGVVANVQPSLNAAFVDIGEDRHGFLAVGDVLDNAYHKQPPKDEKRPRIDQVLERGKPILVQVTKDGSGQKGPALTTNLALAGRHLVLMPFDKVRGVSRKVEDDAARKKIKERVAKLELPEGTGAIVRTNALEQTQATLNRDASALLRLWKNIESEANKGKTRGKKAEPRLLYSDQDLLVQALRDYLDTAIEEVLVDDDEAYERVEEYMKAFMPRSKTKLKRYAERVPLFSRFNLERQIERIYDRTVALPGGGSIVIDGTEALTAIDVNSGRATRHGDHDENIVKVNCEAAAEVARQLRLRDIGGLVVVDFIDMRPRKHQRKVEKVMRDEMKIDRARYSVGRISPNGLLEINRQRLKQSLRVRTHRPCATCNGVGSIPSAEFMALGLLRRIEARAATGLVEEVTLAVHPEVANALQNRHRRELAALESEFGMKIEILAAANLGLVDDRIDWKQREAGATNGKEAPKALSAKDLTAPRPAGGDDEEEDDEDEAETEDAERAEESQETRKGRSRGRRGGSSRRRGGSAKDDAAKDDGEEKKAASGKADDDEESDEEATQRRNSRRRRRRRGGRGRGRGGSSAGGGKTSGSTGGDADASRQESAKESPKEARGDRQQDAKGGGDDERRDGGETAKTGTSRRGSSRQRKASDGDTQDDGGSAGTSRGRGRRRRRRADSGDASEETGRSDGGRGASETSGNGKSGGAKSDDGKSGDEKAASGKDTTAGSVRRGSTRRSGSSRRRGGTKDSGATKSGGSSAAAASAESAPAKAADAAASDDRGRGQGGDREGVADGEWSWLHPTARAES